MEFYCHSLYQVKSRYESNDVLVANYKKTHSAALREKIYDGFLINMCNVLSNATMNTTKVCTKGRPMNQSTWFQELVKHRFVASPSGISIDTHFTWDALLAGCIPIIPRSKLSPLFADLPVWIVDDWTEVTDEAVENKAQEMINQNYHWDKLFADGWKKEIERGLCKLSRDRQLSLPSFRPIQGLDLISQDFKFSPIKERNHFNVLPPKARIGPDGEEGFVHDPSFMKKETRPFQIIDHTISCPPPGEGIEEVTGYHNLLRIREHLDWKKYVTSTDVGKGKETKLMCSVYTHHGGVENTNAIWETWGKRCDGFFFASSTSNLTTGHTHLPNNSPQEHEYGGIFQKVRTMMAYLYDNFLEDFDFFHFSGDDTYLIVENLKEFLASKEIQSYENDPGKLIFAGEWLIMKDTRAKGNYTNYYMGGGSGYTLSRKALKTFVEGPLQNEVFNWKLSASDEDCRISDMFRIILNVTGIDTRDEFGAHRFHQMGVQIISDFPRYRIGALTAIMRNSLETMLLQNGFPLVYKEELVSSSSISFHRMDHHTMRRYEMLLYGTGVEQCGNNFTKGISTSTRL